MSPPEISVVMSVYNNADRLNETIESVLKQSGPSLEFIIINDGSTDHSANQLNELANSDPRVKVTHQENTGLTQALATGCEQASGKYIARQDADDVSLPDRLAAQFTLLEKRPELVLCSTGTEFVAPRGEPLFTVKQNEAQAMKGLLATREPLTGPSHHGSTLFRRSAYNSVGGYRAAFKVAQDLDLWTRLVEVGGVSAIPKIYYRARLSNTAISSSKRDLQVQTEALIRECASARAESRSETAILHQLDALNANASPLSSQSRDAQFYYFVASNLMHKNPAAAHYYLDLAITAEPRMLKARIKQLWLKLRS